MNPVANLAAALVKAQGAAQAVSKSSTNSFHRYKYASAEALIEEGREALTSAGLALMTLSWDVLPLQIAGTDAPAVSQAASSRVFVKYLLLHSSGEYLEMHAETSVIPEKGRPQDKAEATALTYNLGYFIRGLLLLPREDENAVDRRDDRDRGGPPEPSQRQASKPSVASAPAASSAASVVDGLNVLADFLAAIKSADSFAALQGIAARAAKVQLNAAELAEVRNAWASRKLAFEPAKAVA